MFKHVKIPLYFFEKKWLDPESKKYAKNLAFLIWAFTQCQEVKNIKYYKNEKLQLEPYEFIFKRENIKIASSLTEKEIRSFLGKFCRQGDLEITNNSKKYQFTCYRWDSKKWNELD